MSQNTISLSSSFLPESNFLRATIVPILILRLKHSIKGLAARQSTIPRYEVIKILSS